MSPLCETFTVTEYPELTFLQSCFDDHSIICSKGPFPSSLVPLFQSESKCETILMKMTDLHENETACRIPFHMKGFALRLVLKKRHKRTRK